MPIKDFPPWHQDGVDVGGITWRGTKFGGAQPCPECGVIGSHFCKGTKPERPCMSPDHFPPTHLYIPPGSVYVHVCSGCGMSTRLISPHVTL